MKATDDQLARVKMMSLDDWGTSTSDREALTAVLAENATLRELRDAVKPGFDGLLYVIRLSPMDATRREEWDAWADKVKTALAK